MTRWLLCLAGISLLLLWTGRGAYGQQDKKAAVSADHAEKMAKGLDVFKKHVKPVLVQKCLRCHGGRDVESEFDLSDRDGLLKGGVAGLGPVPGKARESLLLKLITHQKTPHMPQGSGKLPDETIAHITQWIDLGAPYDAPLVAAKKKVPSWTERSVPAAAKEFWSFQPLSRPMPPEVKDAGWCKNPIDRFILAKLEEAGLKPNPPAAKVQLLRRLYFDLVGLPPTLDEADAFLKESSVNACEKLVQRLLHSPHHGERWARHWLDLARFAESHGFEHDYDRPTAYHYRDFVIEAFNRDVPFDQFVRWQIAGDEIEPENLLALKATGFLAAGVHSTQITKNEVAKHRYDELDDKLATVGTAMLGLTLGCARCHDHKYDPIPQRDYYRLLSTFTTTVRSEVDLDLDPEGYRKAKAEFDRRHEPFVRALEKFEREELPKRLPQWEKEVLKQQDKPQWRTLNLSNAKSKEGAAFTSQPDGSTLVSGKNGKFDVYTFTARLPGEKLTAIRLEALADASLTNGGQGRAPSGHFALSDVQAVFGPYIEGRPQTLKFEKTQATFEQKGAPAAAVLDGKDKTAWAADGQLGKDHTLVLFLKEPVSASWGGELTITLLFKTKDRHNLGRLRLAVTDSSPVPELSAPALFPDPVLAYFFGWRLFGSEPSRQEFMRWFRTLDPDWQKLNRKAFEHLLTAPKPNTVKALIASEGLQAVRLHTQGEDFLPETHFLRRGDVDQKEEVATQSFLQVLMPAADAQKSWQTPPPAGWRTSYRRKALADWLTDVDRGAGRLLARVIVNRLWQHHLGKGLVATPSDFGSRGEPPTHPELLDWLASELVASGWSLRHIHQLIVTSATYQQSSRFDEKRAQADRDNKLWWRVPPRRLEAEVVRDNLLAVSGQLDSRMYGPGTLDEASKRRSIYFTVKRSKLMPMMVVFDAPDALGGLAERPTTTIAPQALFLLNNAQVRGYARSFAQRLGSTASLEEAIIQGYRLALARPPSAEELADSLAFIRQQMETYPEGPARREQALADFAQVLMCLNEFVYVD